MSFLTKLACLGTLAIVAVAAERTAAADLVFLANGYVLGQAKLQTGYRTQSTALPTQKYATRRINIDAIWAPAPSLAYCDADSYAATSASSDAVISLQTAARTDGNRYRPAEGFIATRSDTNTGPSDYVALKILPTNGSGEVTGRPVRVDLVARYSGQIGRGGSNTIAVYYGSQKILAGVDLQGVSVTQKYSFNSTIGSVFAVGVAMRSYSSATQGLAVGNLELTLDAR